MMPCRDLQAVESDVIKTSIIITSADINVFYHIFGFIKSLNFVQTDYTGELLGWLCWESPHI
jgi:hypothetical protein